MCRKLEPRDLGNGRQEVANNPTIQHPGKLGEMSKRVGRGYVLVHLERSCQLLCTIPEE